MKSFLAVLAAAALACAVAVPASAMPTDNGPLPAAPARHAMPTVYVPPAAAFTDTVTPARAPASLQPAQRQRRETSPRASAFDWASAGIGAAATGGLMLIVAGGFGAVHRARIHPAR